MQDLRLRLHTARSPAEPLLRAGPAHFRRWFDRIMAGFDLARVGFRPYSLRRGGATYHFLRHGSSERTMLMGRWETLRAAKQYILEGQAAAAELALPVHVRQRLVSYARALCQAYD